MRLFLVVFHRSFPLMKRSEIKKSNVHKLERKPCDSDSTSKMHVVILILLVVKSARIIYMTTFYTLLELYIRFVLSAENISIYRTSEKRSILFSCYPRKELHLITSIKLIYSVFIFCLYYRYGK